MFGRKTRRLQAEVERLQTLVQLAESRMEANRSAHDLSRLELEAARFVAEKSHAALRDALERKAPRVKSDEELKALRGK